ncbi:hypothetical protein PUN28_011666 [Cardiocondyla obscurior]|uniref:F-box domain-containing protein n=1 Tax=Cardiocondyla obscurior TaxID=286306 RepID=A0AAW2FHN1_9HYME
MAMHVVKGSVIRPQLINVNFHVHIGHLQCGRKVFSGRPPRIILTQFTSDLLRQVFYSISNLQCISIISRQLELLIRREWRNFFLYHKSVRMNTDRYKITVGRYAHVYFPGRVSRRQR